MSAICLSEPIWLTSGVFFLLVISAIDPLADRFTWFLETFPVMIGAIYSLWLLSSAHDRQLSRLGLELG